jgi:two-component system chemotaxis response regulator CheY
MSDKIKLLIVDDSLIIRKSIQKYLTDYNIEVVGIAGDGKSAIDVYKKTKPEVVTLDITMPEIDGLTVLEEMLRIEPKTKIMVVTALSDKATGLKAIRLGAKGFLPKPFSADELKESFARLVG